MREIGVKPCRDLFSIFRAFFLLSEVVLLLSKTLLFSWLLM